MKNVFYIVAVLIIILSLFLCLQGSPPLQIQKLVSELSKVQYNFQDTLGAYTEMTEVMQECRELMASPREAIKDLREGEATLGDILLSPFKALGGSIAFVFTAILGITMVVFNFIIDFVQSIVLIISIITNLTGDLLKPPILK